MDPTTSFNNLNPEVKKNDVKEAAETAGTIASNTPAPLFTPAVETAGTVASNNTSSSSSGGGISYNA